MGYFASLARQTGIAAAAPIRPMRGLEVDVTRVAEAAEAPAISGAPVSDLARPPGSPQEQTGHPAALPVARGIVPDAPLRPGVEVRERVVELEAPPRAEIREEVIEREVLAVPADPPGEQRTRVAAEAAQPQPGTVGVGKSEAPETVPRERRRPTLADVRAWVAHPLPAAAEVQAAFGAPGGSGGTRADQGVRPTMAESYTLEIGTIQIVVDQPAAAPPQRPAAPPRPEAPAGRAWSDPGSYYIRP